jgi:hypothetical protein
MAAAKFFIHQATINLAGILLYAFYSKLQDLTIEVNRIPAIKYVRRSNKFMPGKNPLKYRTLYYIRYRAARIMNSAPLYPYIIQFCTLKETTLT